MSSYTHEIFLAEEIANQIGAKVASVTTPEQFTKTEEVRPRLPHIINHYLKNANEWYEIKFPKNVKAWSLRCRENYDINYCFEPSASTYMTLNRGDVLTEDTAPEGINAIYVRCGTEGVTVEVELWKE